MISLLKERRRRYDALLAELDDPAVVTDVTHMQRLAQELRALEPIVQAYDAYEALERAIADTQALQHESDDPEFYLLVQEELDALRRQHDAVQARIDTLMTAPIPDKPEELVLEIRQGTGGDDAARFAAELYRMYARYAAAQCWQLEIVDRHESAAGYKLLVAHIRGVNAYQRLRHEVGVHRIQRVPLNDTHRQTSTATVAILPIATEIPLAIPPEDLAWEVYRARGHGGQGVNTTDSAVRVRHRPSGLVVTCQDERSQRKNKQRALVVLSARLQAIEREQRDAEHGAARQRQIGRGRRAEKIRSYNAIRDRVTDHRLERQWSMQAVLDGLLNPIIDALVAWDSDQRAV